MGHIERSVQAADKTGKLSHYSRLHLYLIRDRFAQLSAEIKTTLEANPFDQQQKPVWAAALS